MKFYFCESCGKRITEHDIDEGAAKDKKLKGVYCKGCAAGVMTLETMPLTEDKAREILKVPDSGKKRTSSRATLPAKPSSTKKSSKSSRSLQSTPAVPKTNAVLLFSIAGGLALLIAVLLFSFLGTSESPSQTKATRVGTAKSSRDHTPLPNPQHEPQDESSPPRSSGPSTHPGAAPKMSPSDDRPPSNSKKRTVVPEKTHLLPDGTETNPQDLENSNNKMPPVTPKPAPPQKEAVVESVPIEKKPVSEARKLFLGVIRALKADDLKAAIQVLEADQDTKLEFRQSVKSALEWQARQKDVFVEALKTKKGKNIILRESP